MLSNPSGYSIVTDWNVFCYNPEVLVVAPCEVSRSGQEIEALTKLEGWETLKAVQITLFF
jgi:iron complex transport system substrate-binding protein